MAVVIVILLIVTIITVLVITYIESQNKQKSIDNPGKVNNSPSIYKPKNSLLTKNELSFFNKLRILYKNKYHIQAQINLASIIDKVEHNHFVTELFRNIDFGIFDTNTLKPLILIELNDSSHKNKNRYERDLKVREILKQCNIKLITFYSNMPNDIQYIKSRIDKELNEM